MIVSFKFLHIQHKRKISIRIDFISDLLYTSLFQLLFFSLLWIKCFEYHFYDPLYRLDHHQRPLGQSWTERDLYYLSSYF